MPRIGRAGTPVSHISQAYADRVEVRGRDLTGDLMGRLSFTEYFHLLLTGDEPTDDQRFFLDLLLVAIAEHGMMPTNVAARMTLAADPGSLQGAVAAGILGCGPVILGTSEECARLLVAAQARVSGGESADAVATEMAAAVRGAGERLPGFGHPRPRPPHPRAQRILAPARGLRPPRPQAARPSRRADPRPRRRARRRRSARRARARVPRRRRGGVGPAADDERRHADRGRDARSRLPGGGGQGGADPRPHGKPARPPRRGARAAGRLPHGGRGRGGDRVPARTRRSGAVILAPEVETRPWAEQRALDDAAYREQVAYLLERSPFYRDKLGAAGVSGAGDAGGLDDMGGLPLTEKQDLRATATRENPIGAHLAADRAEIVRIYSTSGTTGTPSYIPLTAPDLENWITGSARSYAASGIEPGQRIVSTYNAGPFAAGAALASFERIGLCHIPVGTGNTERLMRAIELLRPEAAVLTPSYAAHLVEWAAERD